MTDIKHTSPVDDIYSDLVRWLARTWWFLILGGLVGAAVGYAMSKSQPNLYRATVTLVPAQGGAATGLGALSGQLQGLAAIAGVSLPQNNDRAESIATLRSRELARVFIVGQGIAERICDLHCSRSPAASSEDGDRTLLRAIAAFDKHIRVVDEDKVAGVVRVSVIWDDPAQAAELCNAFARSLNESLRQRARREAAANLEYLTRELEETAAVELRQALFKLVETESARIMLANVRQDYAFRVVDPATAPDVSDRYSPRRVLWLVAGAVLGGVIALLALGLYSVLPARRSIRHGR